MLEEKKPSKIWLNIFLGLFYLFVFFVLLQNSFSYLDPDFGWHMKIGEQIWQASAVPDLNYENYILEGRTWVDHEWLMNLITYLIYHNFGYIVLSIFFALLVIAALIIQLQFVRKNFLTADRGLIIFLALQSFGVYASLPHLGIRMQEITILNLLLLLVIIFNYNKNKNYKVLYWLLPLFIFWSSAHAGFLIGFFILGLFVFTKILELSVKRFDIKYLDFENVLSGKQIWTFVGFSFLALFATFITPYGLRLYEFLAGYRDSFYQAHISEWQGQCFFPFQYPQLIYLEITLLFLALMFFSALLFKRRPKQKINLWNLFIIVIFSILAFKARRHFPLLFIISAPILAAFFINFFNLRFPFFDKIKIGSKLNRLLFIPILVSLLLASALVATNINYTNRPEIQYAKEYPLEAIRFLQAHPEWNERRIFNEYGWGGYMIWQYPERKLFIDGRLPQYQLNSGATMLREYYSFFEKENTAAKLEEYNIGLVIIRTDFKAPKIYWWEKKFFGINEGKWKEVIEASLTVRHFLKASPEWQLVYSDGLAEIFVKK